MQVRHDEGVAIHIGPKPCAVAREGGGEASAGECTGQPLSPENSIPDADVVAKTEGNTAGALERAPAGPAWSTTLACVDARCPGTGRSHV